MMVTREGVPFDWPILDQGTDGIPDRVLYNDGDKEGWFLIAPKDTTAWQERYNFYLQAILDDGYCREAEELNKN